MLSRASAAATDSASTWLYRFERRAETSSYGPGAAHAIEIPFVFHMLSGPHGYRLSAEVDIRLSEAIADYWIGIVIHGNPNGDGSAASALQWPSHNEVGRPTLLLGSAELGAPPVLAVSYETNARGNESFTGVGNVPGATGQASDMALLGVRCDFWDKLTLSCHLPVRDAPAPPSPPPLLESSMPSSHPESAAEAAPPPLGAGRTKSVDQTL